MSEVFGVPESVGRAYSDGQQTHLVLNGEEMSVCGEFGFDVLSEDVTEGEPVCLDCQNRERWTSAAG